MISLNQLSKNQLSALRLAYAQREGSPLHTCDSDNYLGKAEFTFSFRYNPQLVNEFRSAFFGLCAYNKGKDCWHVPASWFTRDRVRNFCIRNNISLTDAAQNMLDKLPGEMPEDTKSFVKMHVLTPSEWRKPSKKHS